MWSDGFGVPGDHRNANGTLGRMAEPRAKTAMRNAANEA